MSDGKMRTRRLLILASGLAGCGFSVSGCDESGSRHEHTAKEVTAVEDLMRDHGVLRRALLLYAVAAVRLTQNPAGVAPNVINRTAMLFRRFGEDYHERAIEERYVFPTIRQVGGDVSRLVDTLIAQHNRGREITDYILHVTGSGQIRGAADVLARAMNSFAWMYQNHAAREDTLVFPAWKEVLSDDRYEEMTTRFGELEGQIGEESFADAVAEMGRIEDAFGLDDLAQFTAPPPPKL